MPEILKLGPFLLKTQWLLIALSVLGGYLVMRFRLKESVYPSSRISDTVETSLVLALLIWKLSILIFSPASVMATPLALLYFSGGTRGLWLGVTVAAGYVYYRGKKDHIPFWLYVDLYVLGYLAGVIVFHIGSWILGENIVRADMAQTLIFLVIIFVVLRKTKLNESSAFLGISESITSKVHKKNHGGRLRQGLGASRIFLKGLMSMKKIAAIVVIAGLVAWGLYDVNKNKAESPQAQTPAAIQTQDGVIGLLKGNLAPDFELMTLDGKAVKLSSLRGKKVFLNMWATWCPPCRLEMPDMEKFYTDYRDQGVEILAVNLTEAEKSRGDVPNFIKEFGLTFPVVLDEKSSVANMYQAVSIPTTYVLDTQGIIREKIVGPMNYDVMKSLVNAMK